jgi:DNA-binding LacI/PurR family transcriptional regulator
VAVPAQGTRVTIREIADAAGVSVSTVSRALRRDPTAPLPATSQRIREIARELNYHPNTLAKGLRQNRTRTVGVVVNDLNNPFYTEILGEIGESLHHADYSLIVCYSHYDLNRERRNILSLLSRQVDGIIISPIDETSENLSILLENQVNTVVIDSFPHHHQLSYVYTDHTIGIRLAAEHLIEHGHRDIALMIAPSQEASRARNFVRGFRAALQAHGIHAPDERVILSPDNTIESGYETFRRLLERGGQTRRPPFTGMVTISDLLATGIYKLANEYELRIPEDFSIVGYDNIEVSGALNPPLTTVHQSRKRIGKESVDILINNLENDLRDVRRLSFNPHLVVRKSVRRLS